MDTKYSISKKLVNVAIVLVFIGILTVSFGFYFKSGKTWANFRLHDDAKTIADDERCWPEMLSVHRRDGGSWFSWIYARYFARRVLAPLINWRRRCKFR